LTTTWLVSPLRFLSKRIAKDPSILALHNLERGRAGLAATATYAEISFGSASWGARAVTLIAILAGDPATAETYLRLEYGSLYEMGERRFLASTAAELGQTQSGLT